MMHSTSIAVAQYGGNTDKNLPMSDPRQVTECIKVGLAWHKLLNLGDKVAHTRYLDEELKKIETSSGTSGKYFILFYVFQILTLKMKVLIRLDQPNYRPLPSKIFVIKSSTLLVHTLKKGCKRLS